MSVYLHTSGTYENGMCKQHVRHVIQRLQEKSLPSAFCIFISSKPETKSDLPSLIP